MSVFKKITVFMLSIFAALSTNAANMHITLSDSITDLSSGAFENCAGLKELTLPATVRFMGGYVFDGCDNLKQIVIKAETAPVMGIDAAGSYTIFDNCGVEKVYVPDDSLEAYKQATGWSRYPHLLDALSNKPLPSPNPAPDPAPAPSYDWNGVLAAINALGGKGSIRVDVGSELSVPHFIWQEIYGKNITVTFVRGADSFVVSGASLGAGFDPDTGHMLTEFASVRTNPNTGVKA